jgi:hypothetical protein
VATCAMPNLFLNYPTTASDGMQMNRRGRFAQIVVEAEEQGFFLTISATFWQ